ncbi:MAG: hypothetical protein U0941_03350 [Planctomycetaceae bacterium]
MKAERYDTTSSGHLIGRDETRFDDRSRVYQSLRSEVNPATGTVGNTLTENTWFDAASHAIKSLPSGSKEFTKTTFDSLGRPIVSYKGYDLDETTYADASSVADDVIPEQTETIYDHASNVIQTTTRQRYHTAPDSQTGPLQNTTTTPKARVSYQAMYPDALGRTVATVNYGTHGGTSLSRPATIPRGRKSVRLDSLVRRGDRLLLIDGKSDGRCALAEITACDVENQRFPGPVSHTRSFQRRRESSE